MTTLVTGAAGFIGMATALRLLQRGESVLGLDNLNDYYDVRLKQARLEQLRPHARFRFVRADVADPAAMQAVFAKERLNRVVHLAAQAGVRHSLQNPHAYIEANVRGFLNMLEGCRRHEVQHLVYASSSSVYGGNRHLPFSEQDSVDHPVSLYAATKKANELMAHSYSHIYRLPTTGLRFFTVYGPWGRPDMALFRFTQAILQGHAIDVYNHGAMQRDFTYVDDLVEALLRVLDRPATPVDVLPDAALDPSQSEAPYRVFNIGNQRPAALLDFIACIERTLGRTTARRMLPLQPGDVPATCADTRALRAWVGELPVTRMEVGIARFVAWYRSYYQV